MLKLYKQRYTKFVVSHQINQVYIETVKRLSKRPITKFYKNKSPYTPSIMNGVSHTFPNMEFSGVFGRNSYNACSYILGRPETMVHRVDYICDYHLFIRCGDKVYMDVKKVGAIVIPFSELQKNKYWKHYYNMSLMLTNDLHTVIDTKRTDGTGGFNNYYAYEYKRYWGINTATIYGTQEDTAIKEVANGENNCYYRINPYDLENMDYSSQQELDVFKKMYVCRYEIRSGNFNINSRYLYDLAFDYCVSLMEKEVGRFEDKYNLINLVALNDKKGMNEDILRIIYNNLLSSEGKDKFADYVDDICNIKMNYTNSEAVAMRILCDYSEGC